MEKAPLGQDDGRLRSAALKGVRRLRGLSAQEVAAGMNVRLRTYEQFEAGHGRLNLDYLHRFSAVTRSDPYALLFAILIGSPAFAARAADNKMMMIFTILLQAFDARMTERSRRLDARSLISAFSEAFDGLDALERRQADDASAFLDEGRDDLAAVRPKPGR